VLGTDFARTMRAAQAGEEDAFVRLWRDANPAMVRYLRVVGTDDPYDEACEGWVTVVRALPGFTGDETAWRVWVMACARQRAEEGTLRRAWGSATGFEGFQLEGDGDIELEEVLEPEDAVDPTHRGIADTLTALRDLPLGQGEVAVLRLGAELPADAVASVVGVEEDDVERALARALERLGAEAELVSWSLAAPPSRAELADENVALGAFRKVLSRAGADKVKVVASGSRNGRTGARRGTPGLVLVHSSGSTSPARQAPRSAKASAAAEGRWAPSTVDTRNTAAARAGSRAGSRAGARAGSMAGRSRTAALTIAALSVSLASIGGFSAAAYVGVLPAPVQQAMHDAIGAPAPVTGGDGSATSRKPVGSPTSGVGPASTTSVAVGLCQAWSTDHAKGTPSERSAAFRKLSSAAGGPEKVPAYCATALAQKPAHGAPTSSVDPTPGKGKGSGNGTGKPATPPSSKPRTTHTPQGTPASPTRPATTAKTKSPHATPPAAQSATSVSTPSAQSTTSKGKRTGRP
jgi:DNA-directed RNA polymerase specialized sigma24 family protein